MPVVTAILPLVELGLGDLPRVADEGRDGFLVRVVALGRCLDDQTRKVDATLLEHGYDVEARIREHDRRPVRRLTKAADRRFIVVEGDGIAEDRQFCKEKLTTLMAVHAYEGRFEDAIAAARAVG